MLLVGYGTRPEYLKLRPLLPLLAGRLPHRIVFTGQHEALVDTPRDMALTIASGGDRLDAVLRSALDAPAALFADVQAVLVQGDTASALGLAMAAFHRQIPVVHLEAGLRSYDLANPFPEEAYRQQISRIASLHLCPTEGNRQNLEREGCAGQIHVVGNTVLDNLVGRPTRDDGSVLITLHRRENQAAAAQWMQAFDAVAAAHPALRFQFVRHPNPAMAATADALTVVATRAPMPYDATLDAIAAARLIITDSGGMQEEASFFGKRIVVCRKQTERPEILGTHAALCAEPAALMAEVARALAAPPPTAPCPFGDGASAPRVLDIIERFLAQVPRGTRP